MGGGFDERVFTGLKAWGVHLLVAHSRPLGFLREGMGLGRDDSDSSGHRRPGLWEGRDFGFRWLGSGHVTCAARARGGAGKLRSPITSVSTPSILKVSIVSAQAIVF